MTIARPHVLSSAIPALVIALLACLQAHLHTNTAAAASLPDAVAALPALPDAMHDRPSSDWLLDPAPYQAGVFKGDTDNEIILTNGLIRRVFRTTPNGATIALDNLITDEALLRGVKPEAAITIDGIQFNVGGLTGQPNYAYLLPEWVDQLQADPTSMQLVDIHVGKTAERFGWKRVRHHAPDAQWPPKGVYVRMNYAMADSPIAKLLETPDAGQLGRDLLVEDTFTTLDPAWRIHASTGHERSSFNNEGKAGEIYTPTNTAVFAERDLPPETRMVDVTIDTGTDRAASWGPGLALVWDQKIIRLNLRIESKDGEDIGHFGLSDGTREQVLRDLPPIDLSAPVTLRLRVEKTAIFAEAQPQGGKWTTIATIAQDTPPGDPTSVRIGKTDGRGGASDYPTPGELVRMRILRFAAYTSLNEKGLDQLRGSLDRLQNVRVSVHYELYDGLPAYSKWITVHNAGQQTITVDRFTNEILAAVEFRSHVETREGVTIPPPNIHVETDYAFGGFHYTRSNRHSVHWKPDPQYLTQINYRRVTPCLLEVHPTVGPSQDVKPGDTFESFRTFVLPYDSTDRERNGLALRKMYRTVAPWITENPLMHHMRDADPTDVRRAIDQAAEVGFEMIILSFGSGFNIESEDPAYIQQWKEINDYAASKGIEIGGYSLLASRRINPDSDNAINPDTGTMFGQTFGTAPALASQWGQTYFSKLYDFFETTGFDLLEHDGSYPGDLDAAARPPLQKGVEDSRWVQWRIISDFYKWCRAQGIYLNVPDYYYLAGSNKCGMGYRETNWSLPRAQQVIHTRQNIYDGTWEKTPSMGWMFVPLTQYHGGGQAATIEPLHEHLDHYERMIASNLGLGVQACYRGPRLFDTDKTKAALMRWVGWFKEYRDILESDVIHGRRADGRDLDWMLHVNPALERKGMLMVYNPLPHAVKKTLRVNLYYTGLTERATIRHEGGPPTTLNIKHDTTVELAVNVPADSMTWYVIEAAE